jgi:hypothetical protein
MENRDKELLKILLDARRNGGNQNPSPPPGLWFPPQAGGGYHPQGYPPGQPPALPAPHPPELADSPENKIIDRLLRDESPQPDTPASNRRHRGIDLVDVLFWGFSLACVICILLSSGELWTG